ncbi:hypothetical protein OUZ56_008792 [Daphnia magna]|uniref:Uncharacterized protein n=1 Tax=Daphnia magna TaxID=35525 RepID=A0ABR0AE21_9CRUS|nr:hypothetical protein OUZ56_008792 [Daphnia magna]
MEHPDCPVKTEESVRKKWNNFETKAKAVIRNHRSGLNETGGGPSNGPLCNLFQKYWEQYLGIDNPSVAAEIDMAIDTEKGVVFMDEVEMVDHILGRPTSSTPAASKKSGDESDSNLQDDESDGIISENNGVEVAASAERTTTPPPSTSSDIWPAPAELTARCTDLSNLEAKGKSLKRTSSTMLPFQSGRNSSSPNSNTVETILKQGRSKVPKTLRETLKTTKLSLCESSETAAHARMMEQRMRLLSATMDIREKLNDPLSRDEIPVDLQNIIFHPYDNI